jgi:hypothetical protein
MPQYLYKTLCRLYTPGTGLQRFELELVLVAFDAGGENLFGVDASLSVSTDLTAPCTGLVIASS